MGHGDKSSHRSEQRKKRKKKKCVCVCVGGGVRDTNDRGMLDVNICQIFFCFILIVSFYSMAC